MKYSHKLSDAVHILAYLDIYQGNDLSSRAIAASIESNPSVVRSLASDLRKAGLIDSRQGVAGAELAKKPAEISLYDVFMAIDADHNLLHIDPKTNPQCVVGGNIQAVLTKSYQQVEAQAFNEMRQITLQDIIDQIKVRQEEKNTAAQEN